ncbi:Ppx/GppA phosphatase family protein [Candidatus Kapabacteria bacterium]|nr:Ppx/GppA phosphatase family protein [Candidatus Kapabacteria bacterium]
MKIASIDIGTNTILLLIAEVNKNKIEVIEDYHKIARLGEGLNQNGFINDEAQKRAIDILIFYKSIIDEYKIKNIGVVATSAMRDASNSEIILSQFENILNEKIQIIPGEEEARLSFIGSSENRKSVVIDIGGGSTEIVSGFKQNINSVVSLNIGAVNITEKFNLFSKNQENINLARAYIQTQLSNNMIESQYLPIAVAGTPNTIAMMVLKLKEYDRTVLHDYSLSLVDIKRMANLIQASTSDELVNVYNVHPNRADIILGGVLILEEFLDINSFKEVRVSSNGLRFGIVLDVFNKIYF